MATYNVVSGTSHTLGAGTADIVNLSRTADRVTVANTAATNPIYWTTAGPGNAATPPTVGGDNTHITLPNSATTWPPLGSSPAMIGTVSLISTGAQTYGVDS